MYKLSKYLDGIYLVQFEESYDLAMTFLRYQEFYESNSDQIRGKQFTIVQYMDWYVKEVCDNGAFSYHEDWTGFNIPSTVIEEVKRIGILDLNQHDTRMFDIYDEARMIHGDGDFYLIGIKEDDDKTLEHEVAHGLYYINTEYKEEVNKIWDSFTHQSKALLKEYLSDAGYPDKVHIDESQAYLSTSPLHLNDEIYKKSTLFKKTLKRFNRRS
jgi:hypothetical protein